MLSDDVREGAFARRPGTPVAEKAGGGHVLDAGEGQLHPSDVGRAGEGLGQAVRLVGTQPDEGVGPGDVAGDVPTTSFGGRRNPAPDGFGADGNAGRVRHGCGC